MLHGSNGDSGFDHRRELAELDQVIISSAAATVLSENYAGLPVDVPGESL